MSYPDRGMATASTAVGATRGRSRTRREGRLRRRLVAQGDRLFGGLATAVLLALIATVPLLQFFALGYLLHAAAVIARTGRLHDGFIGLKTASRIGQFGLGVWLVTIPHRFFASLEADAFLFDPGGPAAGRLGFASSAALMAGTWISLSALSQGGGFVHFFRPLRATKWLVWSLRELGFGGWVEETQTSVRDVLATLRLVATFWLGLRAYLGAFVLLAVPTTLIAVGRDGPLMLLGGLLLAIVVLYLPFLQIHFAAHDDWRRLFDHRTIRHTFKRAPLAFFVALLSTLLLALPLYLLKVEIVPRDALWLPAVVFVGTIFPTKLITAWAYHRGMKRDRPRHGAVVFVGRGLMFVTAMAYTIAVFFTQYTGWHGLVGLYEHHAFLVPVPF